MEEDLFSWLRPVGTFTAPSSGEGASGNNLTHRDQQELAWREVGDKFPELRPVMPQVVPARQEGDKAGGPPPPQPVRQHDKGMAEAEKDKSSAASVADKDKPNAIGVADKDTPSADSPADMDKPSAASVADKDKPSAAVAAEGDKASAAGAAEKDVPDASGVVEETALALTAESTLTRSTVDEHYDQHRTLALKVDDAKPDQRGELAVKVAEVPPEPRVEATSPAARPQDPRVEASPPAMRLPDPQVEASPPATRPPDPRVEASLHPCRPPDPRVEASLPPSRPPDPRVEAGLPAARPPDPRVEGSLPAARPPEPRVEEKGPHWAWEVSPAGTEQVAEDPRKQPASGMEPKADAEPAAPKETQGQLLRRRLAEVAMTCVDVACVEACLRELQKALLYIGPDWVVRPFGSIASGFGTHGSDLDATCFRRNVSEANAAYAISELHSKLLPLLQQHPRFTVTSAIWTARVPILKLRFDESLDVDLSCHNTEPLPNTQLLRAYTELDPIVRAIGIMVKFWAKAAGVCGAASGHLSSYALTLMVIYFLQVDPNVQLPCLPVAAFNGEGDTPIMLAPWSCSESLTTLLQRFFTFYASEFMWGREVVSVRVGARTVSTDEVHNVLRGRWFSRLHIEDPFLLARNLNCALVPHNEPELRKAISQAATTLVAGQLPLGLECEQDAMVRPSEALVQAAQAKERAFVQSTKQCPMPGGPAMMQMAAVQPPPPARAATAPAVEAAAPEQAEKETAPQELPMGAAPAPRARPQMQESVDPHAFGRPIPMEWGNYPGAHHAPAFIPTPPWVQNMEAANLFIGDGWSAAFVEAEMLNGNPDATASDAGRAQQNMHLAAGQAVPQAARDPADHSGAQPAEPKRLPGQPGVRVGSLTSAVRGLPLPGEDPGPSMATRQQQQHHMLWRQHQLQLQQQQQAKKQAAEAQGKKQAGRARMQTIMQNAYFTPARRTVMLSGEDMWSNDDMSTRSSNGQFSSSANESAETDGGQLPFIPEAPTRNSNVFVPNTVSERWLGPERPDPGEVPFTSLQHTFRL